MELLSDDVAYLPLIESSLCGNARFGFWGYRTERLGNQIQVAVSV